MARLENWSYRLKGNGYTPPEFCTTHLAGNVYGYKNPERHPDGKNIVTSSIIGIKNGLIVTSHGSEYELGVVDPLYEKEYPGAKERLLKNLKSIDK
jgi:hypothetical protein